VYIYAPAPKIFTGAPDMGARVRAPMHPYTYGTIAGFFDAMDDPGTIQCILDIPLAHVALPEALR